MLKKLFVNFFFNFFFKSKKIINVTRYETNYCLFNNNQDSHKFKLGIYSENEELNFFFKILRSSDVCLDIGANMGIFTFLFSKHAKWVYSFEPIYENYLLLELTKNINQVKNLINFNFALSDKKKKYKFLKYNNASGLSCIAFDIKRQINFIKNKYIENNPEILEISTKIYDGLNLGKVDIIKIDVEGHEMNVIKGMIGTIKKFKPRIILIEVVEEQLNLNNSSIKSLIQFLKKLNYQPSLLIDKKLVKYSNQNIPNDNMFFIHKETGKIYL